MKSLTVFSVLLIFGAYLECGNGFPQPSFDIKIVGGKPAVQGQIPYILSLQLNGQHHCGASIIQVDGVQLGISAAHCTMGLENATNYNVTVVAGELNLSNKTGLEQTRRVTRIINHQFNRTINKNDICLLFLDEPFQLNNNTKTIDLPNPGSTRNGTVQVSGWGLLSERGPQSENLMTVEVPVVSDEVCVDAYNTSGVQIFEDFLCAGLLGEGGKDSCQQDSGGPAVINGKLVGIVSFGIGCARAEYPGVYTEVAYFLDWINTNVNSFLNGY